MQRKSIILKKTTKLYFFVVKENQACIDKIGVFNEKNKNFSINRKKLLMYIDKGFICSKTLSDLIKKNLI